MTESLVQIEKAFAATSSILFGKPLSGIVEYGAWLSARAKQSNIKRVPSIVSGKEVFVAPIGCFDGMGGNVVTLDESLLLGGNSLSESEVDSLSMKNAGASLSKISATSPEIIYGENFNTVDCACYGPTQGCFHSTFCWFSKKVAYSFWTRDSDSVFGCSNLVLSSFCIRCHSSTNLTRCFEVNDSSNCSGSYFCHNSEGLQDCMFCFNTKNKRYAIGNVEIGKEAYARIKSLVLASIVSELEKTHALRHDIFSIGSGKGSEKKAKK